ncbi:MAG: HAD family hydrolase [Patescibacteria group bacterium]|nr:HAD family hydrolase [Patescibacteria group bacterium]
MQAKSNDTTHKKEERACPPKPRLPTGGFARRRAVFLDRDGVINHEVNYLARVEDLRLIRGAAAAIRRLNTLGILAVVITNQGGIAKGLFTEKDLHRIHKEIHRRLGRQGARLDGVFYCPHRPEGVVKEYVTVCLCRKPGTLMVEKAVKELDIDFKKSFFVGDATLDILTGKNAGVTTILVETGYGGSDKKHEVTPDFTAKDLSHAVKIIEKHGKK